MLRVVNLQVTLDGLPTAQTRWLHVAAQPIAAQPRRYFFHLAKVTMMLIEVELKLMMGDGARLASAASVAKLRDAWDRFQLADPAMPQEIREVAWMVRSRLFLLADYREWIGNKVSAEELLPDESADVLIEEADAPVMSWKLATCVEAMAALLSGWREACLTTGLVDYLRLLKARAVAYSAYVLADQRRMNLPSMVQDGYVTLAFFTECDLSFTPLEREVGAFRALSEAACEVHPDATIGEAAAWTTAWPWARGVLESARVHAITDRFRAGLVGRLLFPGEQEAFRIRWPESDSNPRNVINRMRREAFDHHVKHFLAPAMLDLLAKPLRYDGFVPGMTLARNYAIQVIAEFVLEENEVSALLRVVEPDAVVAGTWPRTQACVLRLAGSYYVWTGESRELFHCGRRFFVALLMWLELCEEATRHLPLVDWGDAEMEEAAPEAPASSWWAADGPSLLPPED